MFFSAITGLGNGAPPPAQPSFGPTQKDIKEMEEIGKRLDEIEVPSAEALQRIFGSVDFTKSSPPKDKE